MANALPDTTHTLDAREYGTVLQAIWVDSSTVYNIPGVLPQVRRMTNIGKKLGSHRKTTMFIWIRYLSVPLVQNLPPTISP